MYYSQFGEDKILFELFQGKTEGCCIEVGANNGVEDSTTLFFEKLGWRCVLIEPNPDLCKEIRQVRHSELFECAVSSKSGTATLFVAEGAERSHGVSTISEKTEDHARIKGYGFECKPVKVKVRTLDEIFEQAGIDCDIDFISIDVEGLELEVLYGLPIEKWSPKVLLIEDNSNMVDKNVRSYLKQYGYVRFNRTGVNDWYTHSSNKEFINLKRKVRVLSMFLNYNVTRLINLVKRNLKKVPIIVKIHKALTK